MTTTSLFAFGMIYRFRIFSCGEKRPSVSIQQTTRASWDIFFTAIITKHFERYLKWRNPHLYKVYGYGLCKGKPTPKIAVNKAQETLHFRYLKCLVTSEGSRTLGLIFYLGRCPPLNCHNMHPITSIPSRRSVWNPTWMIIPRIV